jgi:hypothetical protein
MIRTFLKAFPLLVFLIVQWIGNTLNYYLGTLNYDVNKSNKIFDLGELIIPPINLPITHIVGHAFAIIPLILAVFMFPMGMLVEFVYMTAILRIVWFGLSYATVFPPHKNHTDEFFYSAFIVFCLCALRLNWASGLALSSLGVLYAISIIALRQNYTSNIVFGAVIAGTVYAVVNRLYHKPSLFEIILSYIK